MDEVTSRSIAYAIDPDATLRLSDCGIRAPREPFIQHRRNMQEFIAFLVIKGEIQLIDEMPDGVDRTTTRAGEIHVIAPGLWQASARPFPPGMVFLWFHFEAGPYRILDGEGTDAVVRELYAPQRAQTPQPQWLIPRQFDLGDHLEAASRAHTELLENSKVFGLDDRGSQAIGLALIHRLHRIFVESRLRGEAITRAAPELAHVRRAQVFIRLHHERPISLADIAAAIDLNQSYLSRCFRRVTGQTVGEAILAARIATAKRLLLDGLSVKEAAHLSGFASASYFCRRFHRSEGQTPLAYRNERVR